MLYHLFDPLQDVVSGFRLFNYITFRAVWAAILAFFVATVVGPGIVESLRKRNIAGFVRTGAAGVDDVRAAKAAVPTMGGVILLIGVGLSGFLFARLDTPYTWIALLAFLAFGALGAIDDARKLRDPASRGISERAKLLGQLSIAFAVIAALYVAGSAENGKPLLRGPHLKPSPYERDGRTWVKRHVVAPDDTYEALAETYLWDAARNREIAEANGLLDKEGQLLVLPVGQTISLPAPWPDPNDNHLTDLQVPFSKSFCLELGWLFLPLGILVIVGTSNAVNLTDGLDGLAIGITATVAMTFAVIAYVVGRIDFSTELHLFYVEDAGELAIIASALAGGSLGFLWFNCHPATVFMGDTGSLSIGGILGVLAVSLRHEITLAIAGWIFVAETLSVIWQRAYFKGTRRAARRRGVESPTGVRWFLCAPYHHHCVMKGLHENKVTVRFWIVSIICALLALATLKVR